MSISILLSTSDMGRIANPDYVNAQSDHHPDPYSTVIVEGVSGGSGSLTIYTNDPAKGRALAAAILQACDETEQERALRAALPTEAEPVLTNTQG